MALPPIVTGSPLFKALTTVQDRPVPNRKDTVAAVAAKAEAQAKDTIKLSPAAIDMLKADIRKGEDSARQIAGNVRDALAGNQSLSLSKDARGLDS